ncbi:MAG: hypothetical protein IKD00_05565 [Candidatus Methanomethylophilaceae archaeon]|nr:hypothetical protein [Candidatus Methanomethylophilaceae archaeon]
MARQTYLDTLADREEPVVKNGLCSLCKGTRKLCGRDSCPLMRKFYSKRNTVPIVDTRDIAGCSPPAVFVGKFGYPKVDIGPLLPQEFGDTSLMDTPERWVGRRQSDIVDMRFKLVRGKYRIDAKDFRKAGRIVDNVQELALTAKPLEVETSFSSKPKGRVVLDDSVQPFGPSGRMEQMRVGNGRFERSLEKNFYDVDLNATGAVMASYRAGTRVTEIEKAFSVGTMGIDRDRRFVPTRWSITAVDDIISKNLASGIRFNETIDDYRVYFWDQLDNRWAIIMMPVSWRYEMIEAWWPKSSWNQFDNQVIMEGDHEFFDGIGHYAKITGSYYAARLAVTEKLEAEGRSAGVIVLREIHPGYDIPLGVWNIRENCRAALKYEPIRSDTLEGLWPHVDAFLELDHGRWKAHSAILKDFLTQRRIDDYY